MKRITLLSVVLGAAMFSHSQAQAAIAYDDASDAVYNDGWTTGDNGGSGFGAWTLSGGGTATHFIGSSANNDAGNIDVAAESFGLHADFFDSSGAARALSTPMSAGQTFNVRLDVGTVQSLGSVGFQLNSAGISRMRLFQVSGSAVYEITDGTGTHSTGVSSAADLALAILITGANSYDIDINGGGFSSGTFASSGAIDGVSFFNNFAGPGLANDFYFNSMEVVPEPAVTGGLACLVLLGAVLVRARRVGLRGQN